MPEAPDQKRLVERPLVALLTGGGDRPYALGLVSSLVAAGLVVDFIGSDDLRSPDVCDNPQVRFLNIRGDQRSDVARHVKARRLVAYYIRLIRYSFRSQAPIFHILWVRLEHFERTLLQLLDRARGKRVVLTLHNVNKQARDGTDTRLNRLTLRFQYCLSHHLFVHTKKMKAELEADYGVHTSKITVIPFGINSTVPNTELDGDSARHRLGLAPSEKVVLFFGNIAPYKGLEYLVDAFERVATQLPDCRLVIVGRPKPCSYWDGIEKQIDGYGLSDRTIRRIEYVPDEDTEVYFKAADVLALPYVEVFQSGVLFLAYNFGLPVIATDVATMKDDILEGTTGFVCERQSAAALASTIEQYFSSPLYRELARHRSVIQRIGRERHSWSTVGRITQDVYKLLLESVEART